MKKNMGMADRTIRLILAATFAILYFSGTVTGTWGMVLFMFSILFAITSFASFCPMYLPFGINTGGKKSHAHS